MIRFFVLPAACWLLPAAAFAQDDRPSHVPVPRTTDADPSRLFRERIQQSQMRGELDSLLKQFGAGGALGNAEQMRRLLETNPQFRDMVERMQHDLRSGDPETQERLRGLIDSVLRSNPDLARRHGLTPEMVAEQLQNLRPGRANMTDSYRYTLGSCSFHQFLQLPAHLIGGIYIV